MDARLENKLRWKSRRGLLELDLLLDKFWQQTPKLSAKELQALAELLELEDGYLWDAIRGEGDVALSSSGQKMVSVLRGV